METDIKIKDILVIAGTKFRVIGILKGIIALCQMDITSINIIHIGSDELSKGIAEETVKLIKEESGNKIIDIDNCSESIRRKYSDRLKIVNAFYNECSPLFENIYKRSVKDKCLEGIPNVSKQIYWRTIRTYLQSGLDPSSLIDGKVKGNHSGKTYIACGTNRNDVSMPVTSEIIDQFDYAIKNFYLRNRQSSLKKAYQRFREKYYMTEEYGDGFYNKKLLPESETPTWNQFRYYYEKYYSKQSQDEAKSSRQIVRNEKRILNSDSMFDVNRAGEKAEADTNETNYFLVSTMDTSVIVGKCQLYIMIDVYSRLIVGYAVTFENNSYAGLTNCLLSFIEDKVEKCKRFNIGISESDWPSGNCLPSIISSDHGSDYVSKDFQKFCEEQNISIQNVPPGTGSMKGIVEQFFHQFDTKLEPYLVKKGMIENFNDSKHEKTACLNINQFEELALSVIVAHNKSYMKDYPLTSDMLNKNINPVPCELWKYSVEEFGSPKIITNHEMYRYSLLSIISASIDRQGIHFKGLRYDAFTDEWLQEEKYRSGTKRTKPVQFRMDTRDISRIYYYRDNKVFTAYLNELDRGMVDFSKARISLADYESYRKNKKERDRKGLENNAQIEAGLDWKIEAVLEDIKPDPNVNRKDMDKNRHIEKENRRKDELIYKEETKEEQPKEIAMEKPMNLIDALTAWEEDNL